MDAFVSVTIDSTTCTKEVTNIMIVDWYDNCVKIHKKHRLSDADQSDRKYSVKQEVVYLIFLRSVLKLDKDQCYSCWCKITNGTASVYCADLEEQQAVFDRLWIKSQKHKYVDVSVTNRLKPVHIYKSEVDYINALNAPIWVKQYWLCLLLYYKFAVQISPIVQKTQTLNSWCIRQVDYKKKNYGGKCQDLIADWMRRNNKPVFETYASKTSKDRNPLYKPLFLNEGGDVAITCNKISGVKRVTKLACDFVAKCPVCGCSFVVNPKTKRVLCANCYNAERKRKKAEFIRSKRAFMQKSD